MVNETIYCSGKLSILALGCGLLRGNTQGDIQDMDPMQLSEQVVRTYEACRADGAFVEVVFGDVIAENHIHKLIVAANQLLDHKHDGIQNAVYRISRKRPKTTIGIEFGQDKASKAADVLCRALSGMGRKEMKSPLARAFVRTLERS